MNDLWTTMASEDEVATAVTMITIAIGFKGEVAMDCVAAPLVMRTAMVLMVAAGEEWHHAFPTKTAQEASLEFRTRGEYWVAAGYGGGRGPKTSDDEAYVPSAEARRVWPGTDDYTCLEGHIDVCRAIDTQSPTTVDQDQDEPVDEPAMDSTDPAAVASVIQIYQKTRRVMQQHIREGEAARLADAAQRAKDRHEATAQHKEALEAQQKALKDMEDRYESAMWGMHAANTAALDDHAHALRAQMKATEAAQAGHAQAMRD